LKVYELKLKLFLLKDLTKEDALNQIAYFIDETLSKKESLLRMHQRNCYKNYVFCSFYPTACGGVYIKNMVYTVVIRTIDLELAEFFSSQLSNHYNETLKGLTCDIKIIPKRPIEKIYSLTPVLLKDKKGYWKGHLSFQEFENRLKVNLIKKYNAFTNSKIQEDFQLYTTITILNKSPIKIPYKGIHLLGDKVELKAADNALAQELLYMCLGSGMCESNARGFGFMNYQWYKEGWS